MRMRAGSAAALVLGSLGVAGLVASSCAVPGFDQIEEAPGGNGGSGNNGASTSSGGGGAGAGNAGGSGACNSLRPPSPPATTDTGSDVDFLAAMYTIQFGEDLDTSVGPEIGYDLDKECTCIDGGAPTCVPVGNAPVDCDGPRGRDNAVARMFAYMNILFPDSFDSENHTSRAQDGSWTLLVRVMDYNGMPNDDSVRVALYPSPGRDDDPCLPNQTPNWDGTDTWPVDAFAIEGYAGSTGGGGAGGSPGCGASGPGLPLDVDQPAFVSSAGYVTDSVLVADLPKTSIILSTSNSITELKLVGGFIIARLEQQAQGWFMYDGVLNGRWKMADLFGMIGELEDGGARVCSDHPLFDPMKTVLCNFLDITADVVGPAAPCDSVSFGMGFEGRPALFGPVLEGEQNPLPPCLPGTDPADETCN